MEREPRHFPNGRFLASVGHCDLQLIAGTESVHLHLHRKVTLDDVAQVARVAWPAVA